MSENGRDGKASEQQKDADITSGEVNKKINPNVRYVGFISAVLVTAFTILFIVNFGIYMSETPLEWSGIESFAESFNSTLYLAWVIPCLLLALSFPIMISSIHFRTLKDKQILSFLGVIFSVMYGAILSANYFVLATVVRSALVAGQTEGLEWFVVLSPFSITNSLEGIGYGFMGLSAIFAGLSFENRKLGKWIKRLFIINGFSGVLSLIIGPVIGESGLWVALAVWVITFPLVTSLVAIHFWKSETVEVVD